MKALRTLSLVFSALLIGCEPAAPPVTPVTDPWFNPADTDKHEFVTYPSYLYRAVIEPLVAEAITALGDKPLLQLSTAEAERYAGSELNMPMELRPFLIYGLSAGGVAFNVFIADRALWVDSAEPAPIDGSVVRQPLVIFIDEVPPDIYVTLGAAAAPGGP